ncbi:TPA: hypothetical protein HA265_07620 [Candidatus Woesearchaeota archaeon]|nr:hypothetical protein [Candidatus Woesearchaeota archaeon]
MAWVNEIAQLFRKLSFYDIVYEYQQGLFFRNGRVIEKRVKRNKKELEEIVAEEKELVKQRGYVPFIIPFSRPKLPEGYRRSFFTGMPRHPKRYQQDKILRPGLYFNVPVVEHIIKESKQERVLNLGNINLPTTDKDSKAVMISCNIRYELTDLHKAYIAVHDYEASLKDHVLSVLAEHCRGRTYDDWKDSACIEEIEKKVVEELRPIVTDRWGLKIHCLYITDNAACHLQRVLYEGTPPGMTQGMPNQEQRESQDNL